MGQRFAFGIVDTAIAQSAEVSLYDMHTDVDAICKAYETIAPVAQRLGVDAPTPRLPGLAYCHVSTIGCEVKFSSNSVEPWTRPCIKRMEDIDDLSEPDD